MIDSRALAHLRQSLTSALEGIPGEDPAGTSLQLGSDIETLRELAREDDASLPTGVWETTLKRADWSAVEALGHRLLIQKSKDLTVASLLGMAWLHRYQLKGLCAALELVNGLCERYGGALHPRPQGDDASWLGGPLAWMVRHYSEAITIYLPLLGDQAGHFAKLTLAQWAQAQRQAANKSEERQAEAQAKEANNLLREWREIVKSIPRADLVARLEQFRASVQSLEQLTDWSDAHLSDDSPSFSVLLKLLEQHIRALQEFVALHPEPQPEPAPEPMSTAPMLAAEPEVRPLQRSLVAPVLPSNRPDSREAAYEQLKVISDYLAALEPHSLVPYLLERAIVWGDTPLRDLLGELVNADVDTRRVWSVLGVLP